MNSHELAQQLHSGDPEAYGFIISSFSELIIKRLRKFGLRRSEARDIWSDCLLKLWATHCENYDPNRGPVLNWLLTVACNLAIDRIRANRHARFVALVEAENLEDPNSIEAKYSGPWDRELVERAIPSLKKDDQTVVNLRYGHDLTYAEISQILGESPAAVGMNVHRAVRRLRTQVERTNNAPGRGNHQSRAPNSS